jgi:hypothetical protein
MEGRLRRFEIMAHLSSEALAGTLQSYYIQREFQAVDYKELSCATLRSSWG